MAAITKTRTISRAKSTTSRKQIVAKETTKSQKTGDEIWDELLATPESDAFLTLMVAEVREEEAEGRLIDGAWNAL
jgi:hypothetical protein